jgi:hypothetical protein
MDDFKKGSTVSWYISDPSVVVGDYACYMDEDFTWVLYTDRRLNIAVSAHTSNPEDFSAFLSWVDETSHPQPVGDEDVTPATPTHATAARR